MKAHALRMMLVSGLLMNVTQAAEYYEWPDPEFSVVVDTQESDLWPISNLIQGPGDGFSPDEPHDKVLGGSGGNWVTADDAGFPSDYIEDVGMPVIQFDLGEDVPLKEISVWGYASTNANGTSRFSLRFATDAEGGADGIEGSVDYGSSISYNPTFDLSNVDTNIQQYKLFDEHVTARYVEFTNVDNFFIAPGQNPGPDEFTEEQERLLPFVPGGDRVGLGEVAFMILPDSFQVGDKLQRKIADDDFGVLEVTSTASISNVEFGPAGDPEAGLLQTWVDGSAFNKTDLDFLVYSALDAGTTMTDPFRAADSPWWSGSAIVTDVVDYPDDVFDITTGDAYTVKLEGELLVPDGAGTVQFLDGVDDYTYFALDTDGSGVAGDSAEEVLINDSNWTDALSTSNGGAPIVEADLTEFEGEWIAMEFSMSEGGGGDAGILYWDALDGDDIFPLEQGDGVLEEDAAFLVIPNENLRSSERELTGLDIDANGTLADVIATDVFELIVQVSPTGNDQIALANGAAGDGVSALDVSDVTIRISADGEIAEGTEFEIFAADMVTGIDSLTLLFDDASLWNTSQLSEGILTFGPGSVCDPNSAGDLDGNGTVEFADFLILSGNFGLDVADHTEGDIDCNGSVEFADFLVLSGNFGNVVGGAESVPEPSGLALLSIAGLLVGLVRRRRS